MKNLLNPYISFNGNAREAMEFYKTVFGGKLTINTFKDFHAAQDPAEENNIMHSVLEVENGITFMAADTMRGMEYHSESNISMCLNGDDEELLRGYWEKLSDGAKISHKLEKAPWGDTYGDLTDKFGITWMVNIAGKKA